MQQVCKYVVYAGMMIAVLGARPMTAAAANQEPAGINLGLTSFFDGFGPTGAGFIYQAYLSYSASHAIYNGEGTPIEAFRDPRITTYVMVHQLMYFLPDTLFGGAVRPGIDLILPVVLFDTSFGTPGPALTDSGAGIGDLTFGPSFQIRPVMAHGHPVFTNRVEFDLVVPTGRYDPTKNLNQGANFVSFNPYWASTVLPLPGVEISWRANYIFNFVNERPVNPPHDPANPPHELSIVNAQAGQMLWINFSASYEILHSLHIGANGYYLKQLTADTYRMTDGSLKDGVQLGEGKAQVLGIGPGAFWNVTEKDKLWANVYFQTMVQARPASTVINLRYLRSF